MSDDFEMEQMRSIKEKPDPYRDIKKQMELLSEAYIQLQNEHLNARNHIKKLESALDSIAKQRTLNEKHSQEKNLY